MGYKRKIMQWYQTYFRVMIFSIRGFKQDNCSLRASALTLYTLFSIVPVMAMAFGIAKGFGFQQFLEAKVISMFEGQEEVIYAFLKFSTNLLDKTKGGLVGILGVIFLTYFLVKLMGHIENAFNQIWWVKDDRPIVRKITDYITISIAAGLLVIFSSSATIFITTRLEKFLGFLSLPAWLENLISFGFNIFPFISTWLLFVFFYVLTPNTKINVRAAIAGGIIAGTIFQVAMMIFLKFGVVVSQYNAIYGSFAALPLFLIWLQTSWFILLFGAEIAFAWENTTTLESDEWIYEDTSIHLQKLLSLRIVLFCVSCFVQRKPPANHIEISRELKIPLKMVKILVEKLVESQILFAVSFSKNRQGYSPAMDVESLTIMDVITALEQQGDEGIQVGGTLEIEALDESLNAFACAAKNSLGERKLKDI